MVVTPGSRTLRVAVNEQNMKFLPFFHNKERYFAKMLFFVLMIQLEDLLAHLSFGSILKCQLSNSV